MASLQSYVKNNPLPSSPDSTQPGFFANNIVNPIKNAFNSGVSQFTQSLGNKPSLSNTLSGASGLATTVTSPLAPIGNAINKTAVQPLADKISDNPQVQNFAMSGAGQATANVAQDVGNAANVAGTIAGGMEAGNIWDNVHATPTSASAAELARSGAANTAVSSLQDMTGSVGDFKNDLGTSFKEGAAKIEQSNPNARLTLNPDQIQALNNMKEGKSFALPDYLKPTHTPEDLSSIHQSNSLTPTQTQDLITQLNKSTFTEKSSGLTVDQTKIGLTNEIKQAAQQQFGDAWKKVYSDYSEGINAVEKISDIVNFSKDATASDINKSLQSVLKLSKTPEGKIILQNAVNEFKQVSGIDLTQGTQSIAQVLDKQSALEEANKPGFLKQVVNPVYLAKAAVRYGVIYLGLKGIINALKTQ